MAWIESLEVTDTVLETKSALSSGPWRIGLRDEAEYGTARTMHSLEDGLAVGSSCSQHFNELGVW